VFIFKDTRHLASRSSTAGGNVKQPRQYDPVRHPQAAEVGREFSVGQDDGNDVFSSEAETLKKKPLNIKNIKLDENRVSLLISVRVSKKLVEWCRNT